MGEKQKKKQTQTRHKCLVKIVVDVQCFSHNAKLKGKVAHSWKNLACVVVMAVQFHPQSKDLGEQNKKNLWKIFCSSLLRLISSDMHIIVFVLLFRVLTT